MKPDALLEYSQERESLKKEEIDLMVEKGCALAKRFDLVELLASGGTALFPHTFFKGCADQAAAVAFAALHACQKTGKNQLLVLGVLHSLIPQLDQAKKRELEEAVSVDEPCRGIFGPGLPGEEFYRLEFSLDTFVFLLKFIAEKWKLSLPKLILRYPNLAIGHPETLKGMDELKKLARDSVIVATGDLCHHGPSYGDEKGFDLCKEGLEFARKEIQSNLDCMLKQDYFAYRQNCQKIKSDTKDVGQVLLYLLGPLEGHLYDLRLVDVSSLFEGSSKPSWVATALVGLQPS
jgi:hypothetical protein